MLAVAEGTSPQLCYGVSLDVLMLQLVLPRLSPLHVSHTQLCG